MTTCHHCAALNQPNYVVCGSCGRTRVIAAAAPANAPPRRPAATTSMPVPGPTPAVIVAPVQPRQRIAVPPPAATTTATGRFARDITRYLCAATVIDPKFNRNFLRKVYEEPFKAVATSPGVDLTTVLRYGIGARRRQLGCDALVALLLVLGFFASAAAGAAAAALPAGLFLGWVVVLVEDFVTRYGATAQRLARARFDPAGAPTFTDARTNARLADIAARDRGNVTVFGAYSPFLGYGVPVGSWSFALDTAKAAAGRTVAAFDAGQLHDHVAARVGALDLPGVAVDQRVFVNGEDLLGDLPPALQRRLLPDHLAAPEASMPAAEVRRLLTDGRGRARAYTCVRVAGWSGELVLSIFLRFDLSPKRDVLFVEASYSLLTPVRDRYREIDRLAVTPTQVLRLLVRSPLRYVARAFGCWPRLGGWLCGPLTRLLRRRADRRQILGDLSFNYGAAFSAREEAGELQYHRYFQQLDKEMFAKTAERRILDALTGFLDDHGVDTADFRERETTILNHGVLVTGNASVKADTISTGAGSVINSVRNLTGLFEAGAKGGKP
jgi:hypothetical protein